MLVHADVVTSQHNIKGLRKLYDLIESQVRGLRTLGVTSETYEGMLSSIILKKLPQELCLIVSCEAKERRLPLKEMMRLIDTEIKTRKRTFRFSAQNSCGNRPPKNPIRNSTSAALLSNDASIPKHSYCQQSHSSNSCKTVMDPSERKQILRRTERCFVCLRKQHTSKDCRTAQRCSRCSGRHHVSICTGPPTQDSPRVLAGRSADQGTQVVLKPPENTSLTRPSNSTLTNSTLTNSTPTTTSLQCLSSKVPVLLRYVCMTQGSQRHP